MTAKEINVKFNVTQQVTLPNEYQLTPDDYKNAVQPQELMVCTLTDEYIIYNSMFCPSWYLIETKGPGGSIYVSPKTARRLYSSGIIKLINEM